MRRYLYNVVRTLLHRSGYRLQIKGEPIRNYEECFANLIRQGFQPQTVFDVGVADGTSELYKAFPQAQHVLIEPLVEYTQTIQALAAKYKILFFIAAAGSQPGTTVINIGHDMRKSSVLRDLIKSDIQTKRTVPVITLDGLRQEHDFLPPYLLKVDVEGAELLVLEGSKQLLVDTDVVILEVSVWDKANPHIPEVYAVVSAMKHYGFVVYDIIGAAIEPANGGLRHVDFVFVKENGLFRSI